MKKAVILGAGLATRLYPITHHIPKVLVNYKQHTILKNLHDIYTDLGADEIIVVVHSKFKSMVRAYAQQEGLKITIECVDESFGSAYALALLDPILLGHNVIVNWCDIIPDFGSWCWEQNTIYTKGDKCRYNFDGSHISNLGKTGGNVVGIYQINDWEFYMGDTPEQINEECQGQDFVDYLYGKLFKQSELMNIIDLGDMDKLEEAHAKRSLNRSFNMVDIDEEENVVFKYAVNLQGSELQRKELLWYSKVTTTNVPKILDVKDNFFVMERVKGAAMFDYMNKLNSVERISTVDDILDNLKFLGETYASEDTIKKDFTKEFYTKVLERCESIQPLIDSFGKISTVNGVKIGRLKPMLTRALEHLIKYHNETQGRYYGIIHGDPNFSNIIKSDDGIKFIDPRGYFGNTAVYGPRLYDEAKVLYAISGYDNFNADATWGSLSISNNEAAFIDIKPLIHKYEKMDTFNDYHHLATAIIWVALGGYFKNNPLKAVAAYYHGMKLLTKQLNKMGRLLKDGTVTYDVSEPMTAVLTTKNPDKWILLDKETGVSYKPSGSITHQWERI